jgi:hypothetical protein
MLSSQSFPVQPPSVDALSLLQSRVQRRHLLPGSMMQNQNQNPMHTNALLQISRHYGSSSSSASMRASSTSSSAMGASLLEQRLKGMIAPVAPSHTTSTSTANDTATIDAALVSRLCAAASTSSSIQEAIAQEKRRLVQNIIRLHEQAISYQEPTPIAQPPRPQPMDPNTSHTVCSIGSENRRGKPYVDVTELPGIEQLEAVVPRNGNNGGVTETFPEVSCSLLFLHLLNESPSHCIFDLDRNCIAC